MKKITLLLFLALTSCGISYDGETRLILETTVLDRNGDFLSGIETKVRASNGSDDDLISSGFSNSYGTTFLTFTKPLNASIDISFSNEQSGYDTQSFYNINPENFDNYKLIMNEVVLLKTDDIVNLRVSFIKNSSEYNSLISSRIEGLVTGKQSLNLQDDEFNYPEDNSFMVAKNQNVVLHYTLINNDTKVKTDYTFPISIENESISQIINY